MTKPKAKPKARSKRSRPAPKAKLWPLRAANIALEIRIKALEALVAQLIAAPGAGITGILPFPPPLQQSEQQSSAGPREYCMRCSQWHTTESPCL